MEFDKNKIKTKIAISKIKEENDIVMENKTKSISKTVVTAIVGIVLSTGVVFAGTLVYENIWKIPQKVELSYEITDEVKKENIPEEKAKEIAIEKLKQIGFNSNIIGTDHYKDGISNCITYCFNTEDNYQICINGQTGEFETLINENPDIQDCNKYMTIEQAKNLANKYYRLFGFKEGDYEIVSAYATINTDFKNKDKGSRIQVLYNKKYGEIFNPYEYICIVLESKNMEMDSIDIRNIPFDNNEIVITEDEAINIALKEDKKISTNEVESARAKLMIVKMNADAYDRANEKGKYYKALQTVDYPDEERNYYKIDNKVRKAWVVVINYEDNYEEDVVKRYTEGTYSYFVDATTGEIIGGEPYDYIYSEI